MTYLYDNVASQLKYWKVSRSRVYRATGKFAAGLVAQEDELRGYSMIDTVLAQGTAETVGVIGGSALCGGAILAIVQALIKRGLHARIDVGDDPPAAKPNGPAKTTLVCAAHEGLVKLLDERHQAIKGEIEEVKGNVKELRRENQENFKEVFQMLRDQTHRNGDS